MTRTTKKIIENIKRLTAKNARLEEERVLKHARLFVVVGWVRVQPHRWFD